MAMNKHPQRMDSGGNTVYCKSIGPASVVALTGPDQKSHA
jgi:hypothetical protein